MAPPATDAPADTAKGGDSMAARLARQRQQRSQLRKSNLPLEEAAESGAASAAVAGELQLLRTEVANSGATIDRLQTQLKQSEAEMEEMGSKTARMQAELRLMRERAEAAEAVARWSVVGGTDVVGRELLLGLAGRAAWLQQMTSHTPQARHCPPLPPPPPPVLLGSHLRHGWAAGTGPVALLLARDKSSHSEI